MKRTQRSIIEILLCRTCTAHEWITHLQRLPAAVYEFDAEVSGKLDVSLRRLSSMAANLACIGADDPAAPGSEAPGHDIINYLLRTLPERAAELRRLLTQADQILGRNRLLALASCTHLVKRESRGPRTSTSGA